MAPASADECTRTDIFPACEEGPSTSSKLLLLTDEASRTASYSRTADLWPCVLSSTAMSCAKVIVSTALGAHRSTSKTIL